MRILLLTSLMLLAAAAAGSAQSNEFLDGLLGSDSVTAAQASYLVLGAVDRIEPDEGEEAAFAEAQSLGWAPKDSRPVIPIDFAGYSYLIARAFELKGGVMYSLFPSPRYAYRELVSRQIIQGRSDPQARLGGLAAVRILNRALDAAGGAK